MQITEPATLVTDYLMAALAIYWALRLLPDRKQSPSSPILADATRDWRRAFTLLAVASFLGGSYHGFQAMLPNPAPEALWRATLASTSLTSLFLMRAGLLQFGGRPRPAWWRIAHLKFFVALVTGQIWPEFLVVLIDSAASLLVLAGFVLARPSRFTGARALFLGAVTVFVLGALVQSLRLAPHHVDRFQRGQEVGHLDVRPRAGWNIWGQSKKLFILV